MPFSQHKITFLLSTDGTEGLDEGIRLLVNEAMLQERVAVLQALPYERSEARLGHANGFKPKTLATRTGPIEFLEINRRTRVASIFPHELSLLHLVSAILCKTTDEWLIGKNYLNRQSPVLSQT